MSLEKIRRKNIITYIFLAILTIGAFFGHYKLANYVGENLLLSNYDEFVGFTPEHSSLYENSKDGAVKFYELSHMQDIKYDEKTDSLIIRIDYNTLNVYSYETSNLKFTIEKSSIIDFFANDGKLAVAFTGAEVRVYDLKDGTYESYNVSHYVGDVVINRKYIYTADGFDQWGDVYQIDLKTKEVKIFLPSVYECSIDYNIEDDILYINERNISSSEIFYYDGINGNKICESYFGQFQYNSKKVFFDGYYVHHANSVLDKKTCSVISRKDLAEKINNSNFSYDKTIHSNNILSIIMDTNSHTFIYSKFQQKLIYGINLDASQVAQISSRKFIVTCEDGKHIAIIDLTKL